MERGAAVLLIGNELLTGKVQDANLAFLARELFALGIPLRRAVICEDDRAAIVRELRTLRHAHDVVITTGGIGPTHDDVTLEAVADFVGRPLVQDSTTAAIVARWCDGEPTEAHLRLALVPEGSELVASPDAPWPTVFIDGIVVFPGVPQVIQRKWPAVRDRLRRDGPARAFSSRAVYCLIDEFALAAPLKDVARAHPEVSIGSYLQWGDAADHRTKVTFDGLAENKVVRAVEALIDLLPDGSVIRTE